MLDVLGSKEAEEVEEIVFNEDGSWTPMGGVGSDGRQKSMDPHSGCSSPSGNSQSGNALKRSASANTTASASSSGNHAGNEVCKHFVACIDDRCI